MDPAQPSQNLPQLKKPSRRKTSLVKLLATALAGLGAVGAITVLSVPGLSKPIRGLFKATELEIIPFEIKPTTLPITVAEKGSLESSKNQDVQCLVEGGTTIISILPEGSKVKKGEQVCELDSAALRDSLTNQKIATQGAEASYQQSKLTREVAEIGVKEYEEGIYLQEKARILGEIKLAESDLNRSADRVDWSNRMYDKGYVSKATKVSEELTLQKTKFSLEQAQSNLNVLENFTKAKTIKELRSEVEKAISDELAKKQTYELEKSKEDKLEKQIVNCKLYAPGDGIVVYANDPNKSFGSNAPQIEEGATVRERQKIFSLPDISRMQVNTKVHESQIDKITGGMRAKIRVDAFSDTELDGTVLDVAPLPDPTSFFSSDIKVYTTRVRIDTPLTGLRPGMNAEVTILVDRKENVLSVPVQAILPYSGKYHVAIKTPNGFDRREVDLGATNDRFVEILKGVNAGMVIALNPASLLSESEKRELFGVDGKGGKIDWAGFGKEKTAGGDAAKGGEPGKDGPAVAGKGDPKAKAKGKGRGGMGGGGAFAKLKNLSPEDRAKLKSASEEEKAEIFKKAGVTDEELEQMRNMMQQGGGFGGGPPGGGPGGGGGGGGFRGPGGGGN